MFPAQKAVGRLAVSSYAIFVIYMEYHRLTAASLVPSSFDILHEQTIYVANGFIPRYHYSHALCSSSFTHTQLASAKPDQLAEVKSFCTEAWAVEVVTQDLLVPQLGHLVMNEKNLFWYYQTKCLKLWIEFKKYHFQWVLFIFKFYINASATNCFYRFVLRLRMAEKGQE